MSQLIYANSSLTFYRDFSFEGFETLKTIIQENEQKTSQFLIAHIDQAEQKLSDRIQSSENHFVSNIQQLEDSVSTKIHQDTLAVSSSLKSNMDLNFTFFTESTSTSMKQLEYAVTQTRETFIQDLTIGQQRVFDELQNIKQLIYQGCNSPSLPQLVDLTLSSGNRRPRYRRRYERNDVPSEISEMCTCNASITKTLIYPKPWKWFQTTSDVSLIHDRNCPIWYLSQRKVTVQVNFKLLRLFLSGSIEFKGGYYSWRNWTATPSRNLRCSVIVSSNSGAFAILNKLELFLTKSQYKPDWCSRRDYALEKCIAAMHEAFSSGKASPHDIDEHGNNILHVGSPQSVLNFTRAHRNHGCFHPSAVAYRS
jgi:hypothetical protein